MFLKIPQDQDLAVDCLVGARCQGNLSGGDAGAVEETSDVAVVAPASAEQAVLSILSKVR